MKHTCTDTTNYNDMCTSHFGFASLLLVFEQSGVKHYNRK